MTLKSTISGAHMLVRWTISVAYVFFLTWQTGYASPLQYRIDYRRSYLVVLGDTINLTCPYSTPFYKWTPATQPSWILSEDQVYSLKAERLGVSGKYICSAVNGFGHNSAEFNIKVIGPCFLNTYTETELTENKIWGDNVTLDCESVAVEGLAEQITYSWEFYRHPQQSGDDSRVSVGRASIGTGTTGQLTSHSSTDRDNEIAEKAAFQQGGAFLFRQPRMIPPPPPHPLTEKTILGTTSQEEIVAQFTGPSLRFRKVTLNHAGDYRCTVNVGGSHSATTNNKNNPALTTSKLSRTFRLRVQPRSEGDIIQGPHNVSASVDPGSDATFTCEISKGEHRSATIRWGKYISLDEVGSTDLRTSEVLHWSGGTYVILPTVLPQDLQKFFDIPKPLAVSNPGSKRSRLVLRVASQRDSGLYVCSVITESGRDDHKFVHITVKGSDGFVDAQVHNNANAPRRLTIYIAVPICVFLVCVCAVASLLIRNRSRQTRQRIINSNNQRNPKFLLGNQSKIPVNTSSRYLDRNSLTGSNSMGFSLSGSPRIHLAPSKINTQAVSVTNSQLKMHPSHSNSTQHGANSLSPNHIHSVQYVYPSPGTECAYFAPDGASTQCPMVYGPAYPIGPPPTGSLSPVTYMSSGVELQRFATSPGMHATSPNGASLPPTRFDEVIKARQSGYPQCSGESSACTDLGFDQPSPPFSSGHYNRSREDPTESRMLCVSPSSGPESTTHLEHVQRIDSDIS